MLSHTDFFFTPLKFDISSNFFIIFFIYLLAKYLKGVDPNYNEATEINILGGEKSTKNKGSPFEFGY